MPRSTQRVERAAIWIPFFAFAALELGAGDSCSSSSTAAAPDASSPQEASDSAPDHDSAASDAADAPSGCTSVPFGEKTVVCSEPVDCGNDGILPPCTWAAALAFVCPLVGVYRGERYSVTTCTGGLNAWTAQGIDSSSTIYYSATTGQTVASIGGGAPGVGSCQAPCDFVIPTVSTTTTAGDCTVDDSLCRGLTDAGSGDAGADGRAGDAQAE
jgi:hypothetical protein